MDVAGARWEEITIVDRTAVKEVGDRIEVEWKLSAKPEIEWAEIFQMAALSDREGPIDWVMGGGPDVMGAFVRWFDPGAAIENADAEVKHRLSVANQTFGMGQAIPDTERARGAEHAAQGQKVADAQARLDGLE